MDNKHLIFPVKEKTEEYNIVNIDIVLIIIGFVFGFVLSLSIVFAII